MKKIPENVLSPKKFWTFGHAPKFFFHQIFKISQKVFLCIFLSTPPKTFLDQIFNFFPKSFYMFLATQPNKIFEISQ